MKRLTWLLLLVVTTTVFAQPTDELIEQLKEHPDSTGLLLQTGRAYLFSGNADSAKIHFNKALEVSKRLKNQFEEANTIKNFGILQAVQGQQDSAIYYYDVAANIYKQINNIEGYADAMSNQGLAYSKIARSTEAIEALHTALNIYDSLGLATKKSNTLNNLGILFQLNEDYDKALSNYQLSIKTAPENKGNIARCLINIASIYNRQEKYDSALAIYNKALIELTDQNNVRGLSIVHNNVSAIYINLTQYKKAEEELKKAIAYKKELNDVRGMAIASNNMADLLTKMGRYNEAQTWAATSLALSKEANSKRQELEALLFSAQIEKALGQFKNSTGFYQKYIVLKDSLDKAEKSKEIQEVQEKYQTAQRKKEIAELEIQNQQSLLDAKESANQRNVLILLLAIILIIVGFLIFLNNSKQKSNKLLSQALGEKETLLKEIHHRVKNNLQVISSLLNLQAGSLDNEEVIEAVREGQNRVKSMALIHEKLYQETDLRGVDVKSYLEHLVEELFTAFGVDREAINSQVVTNDLKLDIDTVIPLGLILNELITNTLKYAFNKTANGTLTIAIEEKDDKLVVLVKDNGKGVDPQEIETSNSFGWKMIRSLSRKLKAEIAIFNENGTTVTLTLNRYKLVI
jgi:two-component sensor histidine kinase